MNSIERVLAALTFGHSEHGVPDRVPVLPVPLLQGAKLANMSIEHFLNQAPSVIAQSQININQALEGIPDAVAGFPNVIEDVTAFGVGLTHHYNNSSPAIDRLALPSFASIDGFKVPNPLNSKQLVKTLEVIRHLSATIGKEKVVIGACVAPFSLPSLLMGTDQWMRLLMTVDLRKKHLRKLLDVCQRFVVRWAQLQHQAGAHVVVLADGMASATMLNRRLFERDAYPYIQSTIEQIGGLVAYEPVGYALPFIDALAQSGAVALLVGEEDDIAQCKAKAHGRCALIGNVNNMKLRRWSAARTELAAKAAIAQGKPGYGFALANQGPEIPFDVPFENIQALVQAVHKYGHYDHAHDHATSQPTHTQTSDQKHAHTTARKQAA